MHVVEPDRYPLDKAATYQPSAHTLEQANAFLGGFGIEKMVIVQPSVYANDNSCTLDGLRRLGLKKGRAVVQFDPASISKAQLQEWHDLGARGVRLNLKSVGALPSEAELEKTMRSYADAVRPFGWSLELYISLEEVPKLERIVPALDGTKIIIDHFGHPTNPSLQSAKTAREIPGFASLEKLLKEGSTWVKISASYRLSKDPGAALVESLCKEIVRARPDRVVFATDWPHTRYDGLEVAEYLEKIFDWVEQEGVTLQQVLVDNAEVLFDAKS